MTELMSEYVQKRDKEFQKTIEEIEAKEKRKKRKRTKCWFPRCEGEIDKRTKKLGMCATHRARHYAGNLLTLDPSAFPLEEMIDLYKDVFAFARDANIDIPAAVTWLVSEGLNSYERRIKNQSKDEK